MLIPPQITKIIHFIGLGGIGMSGIAEVLHLQGYHVQGSDVVENENIQRLKKQGVVFFQGHNGTNIAHQNIAVVVVSSSISKDNIELKTAQLRHIPIITRAEMLAEIMRAKLSIAVAGTHGKTSTTSLGATILLSADLDPTIINGGILNNLGSNAHFGQGKWTIVEADESDGSFLKLPATIAVITNIDADHLENYASFEDLCQSFACFIQKLPFYGLGIVCYDDPNIQKLLPQMQDRRLITYGTHPQADIYAENIRLFKDHCLFDICVSSKAKNLFYQKEIPSFIKDIKLSMIGHHNVLNSLSIFAMALEIGIPIEKIRQGLLSFQGVQRRFTPVGEERGIKVIDDYAHHPEEIKAVLKMARLACDGKIIGVFQAHRYSRLQDLYQEFCTCFTNLDALIVAPIYSAGEPDRPELTHSQLAKDIQAACHIPVYIIDHPNALPEMILKIVHAGDSVICMGAGDITYWAHQLPKQLQELTSLMGINQDKNFHVDFKEIGF